MTRYPINPTDPSEAPFDKTNPLVGPAAPVGPTVWGLPVGEAPGNISVEHEATAACSRMLPGVTKCSLVLPRRHVDLTKQSQTVVGMALPRGVKDPPGASLQPRQVRAVRLLLAGHQVRDVAKAIGVCRHTISRWMKDPVFRAEVRGHVSAAVPLSTPKKALR